MARCGMVQVLFAFCLTIGLCSVAYARELRCSYKIDHLECPYERATYNLRMPEHTALVDLIPVVVIFHDAGGSGADIVDNEQIVQPFLDKGFAVIAPNAAPRANRFIKYFGQRPGAVKANSNKHPFDWSLKKFVVTDIDGSIRELESGDNTGENGWYFYNIDRIYYMSRSYNGLRGGRRTLRYSENSFASDYIGRDEIRVLRQVLADVAERYGTDPRPTLVAGLGHGGSLVWQLACYAPNLTELYAPIGGAFWRNVPRNCKSGARLVHTHERQSVFWPLNGASGSKRRFARTSIFDNLEMLLRTNDCDVLFKAGGEPEPGVRTTSWTNCGIGGPIELMVTDDAFDFAGWWFTEILRRVHIPGFPNDWYDETDPAEEPAATGPVFRKHGDREPDAGATFKRPGSGARERFTRIN